MPASADPSSFSRGAPPPLAITYLPLDRLNPDPRNARVHSRKQIRQIAASIETFGFNVPILVDVDCNIIAGHGRVLASRHLGWTEVPAIPIEHLTEAQKRAFMIADNRLTETSVWDDKLLAEQLRELAVLDLDFDLEATGFDMGEIDLRIESLSGEEETKDTCSNEPPISLPTGPAVSRLGDLSLLGHHRVLCGNALEPTHLSLVMGPQRAAAVFTDPPYNVAINGHVTARGARHREFAMASGEMAEAEFR